MEKEICNQVIQYLSEKKAQDIWAYDFLSQENNLFDYMIIATAYSYLHQKSLAENLSLILKKQGIFLKFPVNFNPNNEWVLLDFYNIIIHIFTAKARTYYNLEALWEEKGSPLKFD